MAFWLIQQLGEGSALSAAVAGGPEHRPWTTPTVLMAGMFNALSAGNWQRGGGRGQKPKPVTPPKRKRVAGAGNAPSQVRGLASRRLGRRAALAGSDAAAPVAAAHVQRGGLWVPREASTSEAGA